MNKEEIDNSLVLMVIAEDKTLIHVGDPDGFDEKELKDYLRDGCTLKAIKYKDYKKLKVKLYKKAAEVL